MKITGIEFYEYTHQELGDTVTGIKATRDDGDPLVYECWPGSGLIPQMRCLRGLADEIEQALAKQRS